MTSLPSFLQTKYPFLTPEDITAFLALGRHKKLDAFDFYIKLDTQHRYFGIVIKGLMRGYYIQPSGSEITIILAQEGEIAASHELMFYNEPSKQFVEAIEPTELIEFQYEDVELLTQKNPNLERLKNEIFKEVSIKMIRRLETFLIYTPEQRYQWLQTHRSELAQRVPQKFLASFLGITPVSLSRLRNRLSKKKM